MKKIFTTLLVAAALMIGITAKAQVKFGVKGGVNVTSMSFNNSVFDASNRTGFFIGPTVKIQLPLVGLGIDASALYDQREAKVKVADNYTTDKTLRCQALLSAEIQVQAVVANGLYDVFYVLAFQSAYGKVLVFLVEREEHHTAHSLLVFVDMVHQNRHVYW